MQHLVSLFSNLFQLFQNIVSNSVKIQQSPSLFSHIHGKVGLPHAPIPLIKSKHVLFFSLQF